MKKTNIIFIVILIFQLVILFVFSCEKEGYYIDELWSYGLSNSYNKPFLHTTDDYMDSWHSPSFYDSYLTVDPGESFSYKSVYNNQVNDVHPPLYYFILHTICSFFPGVISKWFGLSLNLILFSVSMLILYKISQIIFDTNSIYSIIPVLLYGFSLGLMNTVLYIRMYMLLVLFALLFIYLTLLWWPQKTNFVLLIFISLTTIGGLLTQYFYVVFIFFATLFVVFISFLNRKFCQGIAYGCSVSVGLAIAVFSFPACISHLFVGSTGQEALSQATGSLQSYKLQLIGFSKAASRDLLGYEKLWKFFLVVLLIALAAVFVFFIVDLFKKRYNSPHFSFSLITIATIGSYFLTIKLVSGVANRYVFIIYPFFFIIATYLLWYIVRKTKFTWVLWGLIALQLILFSSQYPTGINYLYRNTKKQISAFADKYSSVPGYYLLDMNYKYLALNESMFLKEQEQTYIVSSSDNTKLQMLANQQSDTIIVYLSRFQEESLLNTVMNLWNYDSSEKIFTTDYTSIFVLRR